MKTVIIFLCLVFSLSAMAGNCNVDEYLKSADGKEKLTSLFDRSRTLALSKLEDLGYEESQLQFKAHSPKTFDDSKTNLQILIHSKGMVVEGSRIQLTKGFREEDCGFEVKIIGGRLINKDSGKDFGSLGLVKEFIRLN